MAELATLARPYAEALFKSTPPGDAQAVASQLAELAQVASNPQLRSLADHPRSSVDQVFDVAMSAIQAAPGAPVKNLLRVVLENNRLAAMPEIALQFKALINQQSGSSDAIVYSAFPIADAELAGVVATLEKRFGRKLNARVEVEPELIGGVRAVVGDEVLDTSVKARLEQMKAALRA